MVTKTYLPSYLCDSSGGSDSNDSSDSSDRSDSSDSSDTIDSSDSIDSSDHTFFFYTHSPINLHKKVRTIFFESTVSNKDRGHHLTKLSA